MHLRGGLQVLASRTFLVGEAVTLADIVVVCSLVALFRYVLDAKKRAEFPHVTRWFATCLVQPQFSSTISQPYSFCEEALQPQPAKGKGGKKGGNDNKGGKKGGQKPAAAAPPPPPAAEKEKEAEAEAEEAAPVERRANPFAHLPKSTFDLEEWKRNYSNMDTRGGALPWLLENFDPEGYSLWRCDYKYSDELQVTFKTSNLATGFTSRADCMRKYAFGVLLVVGDSSSQQITGLWILRGTEWPEYFNQVDDVELYNWSRLSLDADRELIGDMLAWDKPIEGKPVLDGKQFK